MKTVEPDPDVCAPELHNGGGLGSALIVCEHASRRMPPEFGALGLADGLETSHIAWDPGARAVALGLSAAFDAPLVAGSVSRLLYDCNRPPEAQDAIPEMSEAHPIPGNRALSPAQRTDRVDRIYRPFRELLARTLATFARPPLMITVHSFTPVFLGVRREVEIGLLHDRDDRLAAAMLARADRAAAYRVRLNQPYGPQDGVTHTLREHALPIGAPNIMLEIRNDLIATPDQRRRMVALMADWIAAAAGDIGFSLPVRTVSCPE